MRARTSRAANSSGTSLVTFREAFVRLDRSLMEAVERLSSLCQLAGPRRRDINVSPSAPPDRPVRPRSNTSLLLMIRMLILHFTSGLCWGRQHVSSVSSPEAFPGPVKP